MFFCFRFFWRNHMNLGGRWYKHLEAKKSWRILLQMVPFLFGFLRVKNLRWKKNHSFLTGRFFHEVASAHWLISSRRTTGENPKNGASGLADGRGRKQKTQRTTRMGWNKKTFQGTVTYIYIHIFIYQTGRSENHHLHHIDMILLMVKFGHHYLPPWADSGNLFWNLGTK